MVYLSKFYSVFMLLTISVLAVAENIKQENFDDALFLDSVISDNYKYKDSEPDAENHAIRNFDIKSIPADGYYAKLDLFLEQNGFFDLLAKIPIGQKYQKCLIANNNLMIDNKDSCYPLAFMRLTFPVIYRILNLAEQGKNEKALDLLERFFVASSIFFNYYDWPYKTSVFLQDHYRFSEKETIRLKKIQAEIDAWKSEYLQAKSRMSRGF